MPASLYSQGRTLLLRVADSLPGWSWRPPGGWVKLCDLARGRGWGAWLEVASLTCWARRTLTLEADLDTSLEPGPGA